ncbi:ORF6C domain-containing protein [Bacillus smithii]|uniref:ORF6C domain-containing protein n=1 Tax=Bacillus smithii TaxID=1479 RepID=UPI002E2180CA|nr:ORF6C domain-containing protein [Bacillus smithii]MED4928973.1 ORF6C domain-containing protein [Bacillus smithii]
MSNELANLFNKNDLINGIVEINKKRDLEIFEFVGEMINNEMSKFKEYVDDRLLKLEKTNKTQLQEIAQQMTTQEKNIDDLKERMKKTEEYTSIIERDSAKLKELSKVVKKTVYKHTGSNTSPKYILFYDCFIKNCYSKLQEIFEVNSTKKIKLEDFDLALKAAERWRPSRALINKKLQEYIEKQEKGLLKEEKSKALDVYLDEIGGIL